MTDAAHNVDISMLRKKTRVAKEPESVEEDRSVALPPRRQREPQVLVTEAPAAVPTFTPAPETPPVVQPVSAPPVARKQVTVLMAHDLKSRANQAYRMTSSQEGNRSFADFVAKALENEIARLEGLYNGGARYEGDAGTLPIGRPLS